MKNIFKLSFFGVAMTVAFSSCLKDKGFDNGDYGIQVIEKKGVSLPQSIAGSVDYGLLSSDAPQVLASPVVALETIGAQSSDVTVQFALKPSLVAADPDLTLLPASAYTSNLTATIKAGTLLDTLEITIPRASDLDPTLTYGLGLELVSASNGFTVASNMKEVLIRITIKNIYDGEYTSNGYFYHPTAARAITNRPKTLYTTGPNSVEVELGDLGGNGYFAIFTVDPVSGALSIAPAPGTATPALLFYTSSLPTQNLDGTPTSYASAWPNAAQCNNVYDPATKEFRVRYGYGGGGSGQILRVTEEIIKKN
jgi:hypothetical protein